MRSLCEFSAALQLAPDWDTAKYYYAEGLKIDGQCKEALPLFAKLAENSTDAVIKADS